MTSCRTKLNLGKSWQNLVDLSGPYARLETIVRRLGGLDAEARKKIRVVILSFYYSLIESIIITWVPVYFNPRTASDSAMIWGCDMEIQAFSRTRRLRNNWEGGVRSITVRTENEWVLEKENIYVLFLPDGGIHPERCGQNFSCV